MLAGAMLARPRPESSLVSLTICRSQEHWPQLYWLLTLFHRHSLRLRLRSCSTSDTPRLIFVTDPSPLLLASLERWYSRTGRATTPEEIEITPDALAVWLVESVARWRTANSIAIRLVAPRLEEFPALYLQEQIAAIGLDTEIATHNSGYFALRIAPENTAAALAWLAPRVPECVWNPVKTA